MTAFVRALVSWFFHGLRCHIGFMFQAREIPELENALLVVA